MQLAYAYKSSSHLLAVEQIGSLLSLESKTNLCVISGAQPDTEIYTSISTLLAQSPFPGMKGSHSTVSPTAESPTHCRIIFEGPRCLGGRVWVGSRLYGY
jgi:hypothetical protein